MSSQTDHKPMKFAVLGKSGQLAQALRRAGETRGHQLFFLGRDSCDLTASETVISQALARLPQIDAVINAAAYTQVDRAEDAVDEAMQLNRTAPASLARFSKGRDIPLIHISTDYVFDGTANTPYLPTDETSPINAYGRSKLAGEQAVMTYAKATVLRTSWLYDGFGRNFFTTMARKMGEVEALRIVADQYGRPTHTRTLADACFAALQNPNPGLYHVTDSGPITHWADFARAIFERAPKGLPLVPVVTDISSSDYPTPAARPKFSALETQAFEITFGCDLPDWRDMVDVAWAEFVT
ncbi:dTDP-4-dehydrorhamnose reductase [Litorimonas sp. RW-G-Af-16]|uniref:dTDP-4-dehydrorhamnose reductase n=1 Tax=Litorimonas sp. RW-G-Af-16 TaxID=3241168 RepID=UPI00390C656C